MDQYLDFQLSKRYVAPTSKHQLSCQLNLFLSFLLSYPLSNLFLTLLLSQTSVLQEFCLKLSASVLKSHGIPCLHLHHLLLCCLQGSRKLQHWALSWAPHPLQHSSRNQRCRVKSRHVRAKGELKEASCKTVQSQNNRVWAA